MEWENRATRELNSFQVILKIEVLLACQQIIQSWIHGEWFMFTILWEPKVVHAGSED